MAAALLADPGGLESDATRARAIAPGTRVSVYPNAIPFTPQPAGADPAEPPAVAFSGNFEYHPNQSAVRFFRARCRRTCAAAGRGWCGG